MINQDGELQAYRLTVEKNVGKQRTAGKLPSDQRFVVSGIEPMQGACRTGLNV